VVATNTLRDFKVVTQRRLLTESDLTFNKCWQWSQLSEEVAGSSIAQCKMLLFRTKSELARLKKDEEEEKQL